MRALPARAHVPFPRSLRAGTALASPSVVLFLCLFASQAGILVLSPVLGQIAREFDVSLSQAGQLRLVAAPLAAVVAVASGRALGRFSPRTLLVVGSASLAVGSLASAAAPTFELLAVAQVPVWTGAAMLISAGVAATRSWSTPESRSRVVASALAGPPVAWIVGMPLIGLVAEADWRLAFLVVPLPASLAALVAVAARTPDRPGEAPRGSLLGLLGSVRARRWALGELLANSAWTGTLVFSGALFTELHGVSPGGTGVALALVAVAYLAGNVWAGRTASGRARRATLEASTAAAIAVAAAWAIAPNAATSVLLLSVAGFAAAARTVSGTVHGFEVAGERGHEVGSVRAATTQIGYLAGALAGGVALTLGGFAALAVVFGSLFAASTLSYICLRTECRVRRAAEANA